MRKLWLRAAQGNCATLCNVWNYKLTECFTRISDFNIVSSGRDKLRYYLHSTPHWLFRCIHIYSICIYLYSYSYWSWLFNGSILMHSCARFEGPIENREMLHQFTTWPVKWIIGELLWQIQRESARESSDIDLNLENQ